MELGPEGSQSAFVGGRQLSVSPQHADLDRRLDHVLHQLLRLALLDALAQDC